MFKKIISVCEKNGFLLKLPSSSQKISDYLPHLKLGPVGAILQENLKSQWLYSTMTNRDYNVLLSDTSFVDTCEYAKKLCLDRVPFGINEVLIGDQEKEDNKINHENFNNENSEEKVDFANIILTKNKVTLRNTVFTTKANATIFFHNFQKFRKIWWRKISSSPGRYNLTDIKSYENGCQGVQIKSDFPWGSQVVESISVYACDHNRLSSDFLQIKDGRRKTTASFVVSNISLSPMVLNFICDAYEEPTFQDSVRPLMRIHRKLAPYKVAFSSNSSSGVLTDLNDLALYLSKQFKNENLSTLLIPNVTRLSQESQWQQYDQMGIPYTVVLNDTTLKNGIAQLRSRDTTLKEQVHVSEMLAHLQLIYKNY